MTYRVIQNGESRSFPNGDVFLQGSSEDGDVIVVLGKEIAHSFQKIAEPEKVKLILVELGTESLGVYTGESRGNEGANIMGFARFRLGDDKPSNLVELVRQPNTDPKAIERALALFEKAGFEVAVCNDFAGRIVDRLVRPYYNEALRRLDERLATADDLDLTLKLGLGYPEGPISLLERTGLEYHHDVTVALFEVYGERAYAPARRAKVARQRCDQDVS